MRKPEREIYELTCTRLGVKPDEVVFVDDNADNIAAAREFGIASVQFLEPWSSLAELDSLLGERL
jgi:putative hydrolase of the HAD superfamily